MKQKVLSNKLKQCTVGLSKNDWQTLSMEAQEEKIGYLRDLFRLSFRVYQDDLTLFDDDSVNAHEGDASGFGTIDQDEFDSFRRSITELGGFSSGQLR